MCDTNPAALLRAQNTCVYVSSHLKHGSGAVIVASRKNATAIKSRNTGIETCRLVERRAPSGKSVEQGAPGDAGVKTVKKESNAVEQ